MGLFMGSIRNLAGDCETVERFALVNLTDDDANDSRREKLTTLRIVSIGDDAVCVRLRNGATVNVSPARVQRVY